MNIWKMVTIKDDPCVYIPMKYKLEPIGSKKKIINYSNLQYIKKICPKCNTNALKDNTELCKRCFLQCFFSNNNVCDNIIEKILNYFRDLKNKKSENINAVFQISDELKKKSKLHSSTISYVLDPVILNLRKRGFECIYRLESNGGINYNYYIDIFFTTLKNIDLD